MSGSFNVAVLKLCLAYMYWSQQLLSDCHCLGNGSSAIRGTICYLIVSDQDYWSPAQ